MQKDPYWSLDGSPPSAGVYLVRDLLGEDSQFLTFNTFKETFAIKTHFLQYHGVIGAISNIKRKKQCPQMKDAKIDTKSLLSSEAFCKLAYKSFLTQSASTPCKSQEKWLADCNLCGFDTIDWGKLSHIPLLFYVPASLNYVYFNLNFCIEKWQRTVSFLKLESNQTINAVSAKQARKLFCIFFGSVL